MTYRQTYPHEIPDDIPSYISNSEPVPVQELVLVDDDHVDPAVTVHPKGEVSYVKPNGDVYHYIPGGHALLYHLNYGISSRSREVRDASKMLMINPVQLIGSLRHAKLLAELLIGEGEARTVPTTDLVKRSLECTTVTGDDGTLTKFYRIPKRDIHDAHNHLCNWMSQNGDSLVEISDIHFDFESLVTPAEHASSRDTNVEVARGLWQEVINLADTLNDLECLMLLRFAFLEKGCHHAKYPLSETRVTTDRNFEPDYEKDFQKYFPGAWCSIGDFMYSVIKVDRDQTVTEVKDETEMLALGCTSQRYGNGTALEEVVEAEEPRRKRKAVDGDNKDDKEPKKRNKAND
jgi:hypothetical protein